MTDFVKPTIGMGCTVHIGSDSYPYTIIGVYGSEIEVQADKFTPAEGHNYYQSQKYAYEANPKGAVKRFRDCGERWREVIKNPNGRYVFVKHEVYRLLVGERNAYSDPSF